MVAKIFSLFHRVLYNDNTFMRTCLVDLIPSICPVMQTLLDRSHSLQNYMESSSPACQAAEFQKLRHQHAQLLDFNHVLIEENNHRLVDHAELTSEVKVIHCISKASLAGMFLLAAAFLSPHTPPPPSLLHCSYFFALVPIVY